LKSRQQLAGDVPGGACQKNAHVGDSSISRLRIEGQDYHSSSLELN
jgi:hypothetical protein